MAPRARPDAASLAPVTADPPPPDAGHLPCPHCQAALDADTPTGAPGDAAPEPRDLTICPSCIRVLEYVDVDDRGSLGLRKLTSWELVSLPRQTALRLFALQDLALAVGAGR